MPKKLSEEQRLKIVEFLAEKLSYKEIARRINCSYKAVADFDKRYQNTKTIIYANVKNTKNKQRSWGKIVNIVKENPTFKLREIQQSVDYKISISTISRRLKEAQFPSRVMAKKPFLTLKR